MTSKGTILKGNHDIDGHKQVQELLQIDEINYQAIFENATIGIFQSTPEGQFRKVNLSMAGIYGYDSPEEMIANITNISSQIYVNPSKRLEFQSLMAEFGEVLEYISQNYRKDHSIVWTQTTARAVKDAQGNILYYEGFVTDITERKKIEDALRESKELFSLFMRHSPIYVYVKEVTPTESRVLQASDNFQEMIGVSSQDMIGKTVEEMFPAEFAAKITADDWAVVASGKVLKLDENLNDRHYTTIKFPIIQGGKTLLAGYTIDITERKLAEAKLIESESYLRNIIENEPECIKIVDRHGLLILMNPARLAMIEADSLEQVAGRPVLDILAPEYRKDFADLHQRVLAGRAMRMEFEMLGFKGGRRWLETHAVPIQYRGETMQLAITRDITERKSAEDELRQAKEALMEANSELQTALIREHQLAYTDALTGINNRRHLYELAEHEFEIATRYQQQLSVIMFDIDYFKEINDTFGHAAGDQMLQQVTQVACSELRSTDVIGRYGGEEFVVVLPMTNAQQAYPLAERIRKGVERIRVSTEKGDAVITLSIGVVEIVHGAKNSSAENLIRHADKAMYTAKQAGRNRTEIGGLK